MKEQLIKVIINGLHGKNTHLQPKKAIDGLNPENARKKPDNSNHSSWELLHHIVIWQEAIFEAIEGKEVRILAEGIGENPVFFRIARTANTFRFTGRLGLHDRDLTVGVGANAP